MSAESYLLDLQASGRSHFTTEEAIQALGVSSVAARAALRRLKRKGALAMPHRGFFVIVPPEYRAYGCLPPEQFIPQLMAHLGEPHYAGLLTAAQYHGAAHQKPQVFQVVSKKNRPPIACGRVRVEFASRGNVERIPTVPVNTPRGFLAVSTPEATALDLVGYTGRCGGLDAVATVLAELAEALNGTRLAEVATMSPVSWSQRLGFLLDRLGNRERTEPLSRYVAGRRTDPVPLATGAVRAGASRDKRWNVDVNMEVETDL
jgi:predicted transcriptional regulator of viral defense system